MCHGCCLTNVSRPEESQNVQVTSISVLMLWSLKENVWSLHNMTVRNWSLLFWFEDKIVLLFLRANYYYSRKWMQMKYCPCILRAKLKELKAICPLADMENCHNPKAKPSNSNPTQKQPKATWLWVWHENRFAPPPTHPTTGTLISALEQYRAILISAILTNHPSWNYEWQWSHLAVKNGTMSDSGAI